MYRHLNDRKHEWMDVNMPMLCETEKAHTGSTSGQLKMQATGTGKQWSMTSFWLLM
jgi:hypothetical protein